MSILENPRAPMSILEEKIVTTIIEGDIGKDVSLNGCSRWKRGEGGYGI
jgi:hypothetical protein